MVEINLRGIVGCKSQNLKPILTGFALVSLLVGLGGAAYTNSYSNTATSTLELTKGFYLGISSDGNISYSTSIETQNASSGGSLELDFILKNRANDGSQPAVEIVTLESTEDLTWRELESLGTRRENSTGHYREYILSVDARGEPKLHERYRNGTSETFTQEVSGTTGRGFGVADADIDSDSHDEILVCISGSKGYKYSPNETWSGNIAVDTKTSFPAETLEINHRLIGLYDPETGTYPSVVRECPQIS